MWHGHMLYPCSSLHFGINILLLPKGIFMSLYWYHLYMLAFGRWWLSYSLPRIAMILISFFHPKSDCELGKLSSLICLPKSILLEAICQSVSTLVGVSCLLLSLPSKIFYFKHIISKKKKGKIRNKRRWHNCYQSKLTVYLFCTK